MDQIILFVVVGVVGQCVIFAIIRLFTSRGKL